ncbi:MAG: hypothetical protein WC501_05215 [Candidatus Micrarchaeia archaeon]|jgi:hypothetical protein
MDYEYIREKLDILPVKDLIPHEERIAPNVLRLQEAMLNIGQLVDPIIIDKKTNVVLDGNHRLKVLEIIRVPNSICQMVDYSDKRIELKGWYPASNKLKKELFENTGIKLEKVDFGQGKQEIENKKAAFMLKENGNSYLLNPGNYSLDELITEQQKIIDKISGNEFAYVADDLIPDDFIDPKGVLFRKTYTKEEVIKRALSKKLFPPKSTRHLIPDRIIRLNMRLGWLHQDKTEAMDYLERLLKDRVYAGNVRRYFEPVIVIY